MSLVTRLTLFWSLLAAALVGLFGFLSYRGSREHVLATWRETLEHDATTTILRVQSAAQEAARDALYLASTPSVREYVLAADDAVERERWRRLTEEEFRALMAGKPTYFQVRLIGAASDGMELIRLDAATGGIEVAAQDRLQQKGDRDYFQEGRRLRTGEVYVSDLNLNQDFGHITDPHTPTVRTVASVVDRDGRQFGMVVINVDLSGLVATLPAQASPGVRLTLGNERGDYVVHPDPSFTFGSDLGRAARFADGAPAHADRPAELMVERAFPVLPGLAREWRVRLSARESEFLRGLAAARNQALALTALAALGGLGVVLLGGRGLARRLHEVSDAMARYESGQEIPAHPPPGPRDEIGQLADKFRGLATKVRDDVAKLEAARHDAEEAARARDDFLAMMSHEIRTPMNAVTGLLRVLERNHPAPHQEPVLASLRSASRQLLALLDEALDHSKIKAGKVDFHPVDFSLHELLGDVALTHRPLAAQKGLAFDYRPSLDLPDRLHGDAVRLGQVLNNLLGNAVKFTDRGTITLEARPIAEPAAADGGAGGKQLIELTVTDTGIGIAGDNIGRIFSPFDQEHGEIGRRFGGTGLGLSIVRSLVELQGGTLSVESQPGQGSCFRVQLPFAAAAAPVTDASVAATEVPEWVGRRFLYAEDVASNREVMAATLADTGAELVVAECGAEAVERLRRDGPFDLALVDLQLPDMNGLELARALHALAPDLRLLAVTAQVSAETRADCLAHGLAGVVTKPFTPAGLFEEITRWLPNRGEPATQGPRAEKPAVDPCPAAASTNEPTASATAEARLTPTPTEALRTLFPGEPDRVRRLLAALAREFAQHEADFAAAAGQTDLTALRALRHKLHSALIQLHLDDLRLALDALLEAPERTDLRSSAAAALHDAARALQAAAEA
jgi:signal transduction histidine kinase/DNA-binding response OmpR family regulator